MTTLSAALQKVQTRAILAEAFQRSHWLNATNSALQSDFDKALTVSAILVGDSGTIEAQTRAQLEAAVVYATDNVTKVDITKGFFRGHVQLNKADYRSLEAGDRLESYVSERMGIKLANHVDENISTYVAGLTYDEVDPDTDDNDNKIVVGTAGSIFLSKAFPSHPSGTNATEVIARSILDAHQLLAEKNLIGGQYVGDYGPSQFSLICPIPVARVVVDYLGDVGQLRTAGDVAGQALANRGIFGTDAYMGSFGTVMDIIGTSTQARPTGTNNWLAYVVPSNASLHAGFPLLDIDESQFGDGNTEGAYVYRRTAVGEWFAGATDEKHIIQLEIEAN